MGADADDLDHASDGALFDELACADGALYVEAFAEIDEIFFSGGEDFGAGLMELIEGGEGSFIGKIVFASVEDAQAEWAAEIGNSGGGNKLYLSIFQNGFEVGERDNVRKCGGELCDLLGIRVIDIAEFAPGFDQAFALAINVSVIEAGGGKDEFTEGDDWCWFAFGGIVHSIGFLIRHAEGK